MEQSSSRERRLLRAEKSGLAMMWGSRERRVRMDDLSLRERDEVVWKTIAS
jgi:hypothetical protein